MKSRTASGRPRDLAVDERILKTAIELFCKDGVQGTGFEQIAKRSGISRPTIYRRWKTKEELLSDAFRSMKNPAASPDAIGEMSLENIVELLRLALRNGLKDNRYRELIPQLIGSLSAYPALVDTYLQEFVEPFWNAIARVLGKAGATKSLSRLPETELLRDLLAGAMIHRIMMRGRRRSHLSDGEWIENLLRQVGLTKDPVSGRKQE
jgi:AcrR family transcriptional regulator